MSYENQHSSQMSVSPQVSIIQFILLNSIPVWNIFVPSHARKSNKSSRRSLRLLGSLGTWSCVRREGVLGLSILEKERLREAVGKCGTSLMKGSKEKEPDSPQRCTMVLCYNKEVLMDIWEKIQITLECVPESLELLGIQDSGWPGPCSNFELCRMLDWM